MTSYKPCYSDSEIDNTGSYKLGEKRSKIFELSNDSMLRKMVEEAGSRWSIVMPGSAASSLFQILDLLIECPIENECVEYVQADEDFHSCGAPLGQLTFGGPRESEHLLVSEYTCQHGETGFLLTWLLCRRES